MDAWIHVFLRRERIFIVAHAGGRLDYDIEPVFEAAPCAEELSRVILNALAVSAASAAGVTPDPKMRLVSPGGLVVFRQAYMSTAWCDVYRKGTSLWMLPLRAPHDRREGPPEKPIAIIDERTVGETVLEHLRASAWTNPTYH